MAKRFYDTGLPNQMWYQRLTPKRKALYIHLLCVCDCAGTFEVNYPMFSAFIGEPITEEDVFGAFGNRVVPLIGNEDKGILVDFVSFQCGGELNTNVKAHQAIFRRLDELGMTVDKLRSICTHPLLVYDGKPKSVSAEGTEEPTHTEPRQPKRAKPSVGNGETVAMFDKFYAEYPRHDAKQMALLKFARVMNECKDDCERNALLDRMLKSIAASKTTEQWTKNGGQFIPMPSTWLNQRRWEDEGITVADANKGEDEKLASAFSKALTI